MLPYYSKYSLCIMVVAGKIQKASEFLTNTCSNSTDECTLLSNTENGTLAY